MSEPYIIDNKNGVKIPVLSADPVSPANGTMWYNTTSNTFRKQENGTTSDAAAADVFQTVVLTNNMVDEVLFGYPVSFRACIIKYYIERDGNVQAGHLHVATNGTVTSLNDANTNTAPVGITFSADISSGNVRIHYSSTNTSFNASLKYSMLKW